MNNGVTNNNQNNSAEQPVLTPMAGVTIAPVSGQPVNASHSATQTATPSVPPTVPSETPVQTNTVITQPQPQPQITPINTVPTSTPVAPSPTTSVPTSTPTTAAQPTNQTIEKKKKVNLTPLLLIIIVGLTFYLVLTTRSYKNQINQLEYNCTPIATSKTEKKLDIDSTLVKDLYKKVATNIREDIAQPEFNDNMRLYLAYRQILETEKYDSNCNNFSITAMEPYTCEVSTNFVPKAFSEDTLKQAIKKMYGEKAAIQLTNIQLGSSCIVGYQYIPSRKEFVQGICGQQNATSYKVDKTLTKAISTNNTIILTEEVKYHANEKLELPESLKNGTYYYTFRLDMNYNYVLVSKTYESKY